MIIVTIPDFGRLELHHLVTDYNGSLAVDGVLLPGVADRLRVLARDVAIHVITADTFGLALKQLEGLPVKLTITAPDDQAESKLRYVQGLGAERVVALGNGRNDRKMLAAAALGIGLIQQEGAAVEALLQADLVVTDLRDALDLLAFPKRLKATLRS